MNHSTVEYKGIELDVVFYAEPGQKAILDRAPEDCQPGYPPYVEVSRVYLKGVDITALLDDDQCEDIAGILEAATC